MNPETITALHQYTAAAAATTEITEEHTLKEPAICYAAEPQESQLSSPPALPPSVRIIVIPKASRLELTIEDAKKYPVRCKRWYYREELINKRAFEIMLDEYRSAKVLAVALNCSEYMIYRAIRHHGITCPRAYPSLRIKELLRL